MRARENLLLWVAQGFGVGRIPFAPGTFGSVLGLAWAAALFRSQSLLVIVPGTAASVVLSVWCCGAGERLLGRKDPGSVVLDEVIAMPVCFFAWMAIFWSKHGLLPSTTQFFEPGKGLLVAAVFVLFRIFDIAKPWPVRQSQSLTGGWGVTVDDLLAAVYVNLVILTAHLIRPLA